MDAVLGIVTTVSGFLWDFLLLILLCGTGIFFSIRLGFVQVRRFGRSFKSTFGSVRLRGKAADGTGMSSFQALATAVAAQVGTGNLAGAATALAAGGPGAIFWMWVSAFFGMATIYAEATLAQQYKTQVDGETVGGPVYYIKAAFRGRFGRVLAGVFAVLIIIALGFTGNMVQSNSIGTAFDNAFGVPPVLTGGVIAALALVIFLGGVKRIASVTEKIVPIMALIYVVGTLILLAINYRNIPTAFYYIFACAFNPDAFMGGVLGATVMAAVRYGVARGLFSNEAGMGSTPHAHAIARVKHPGDQGLVAMMGVFVDTFVVLNMTVFAILTVPGVLGTLTEEGKFLTGIELTQLAFSTTFGDFGKVFIAICMLFFAFSTIIGWYFFGQTNVKYLFGKKMVPLYTVIVAAFIVVGSMLKVEFVWELSDLFNGLMVIPNLLGVLALSGVVVKLFREHDKKL